MVFYFTLPPAKFLVNGMIKKRFLLLVYSYFFLISSYTLAEMTAESVLGEYWKDPLFGVAAESKTIQVEILSDRLWPGYIEVPASETIRFIFLNRSKKQHLFAFASDISALRKDETFTKFVADELYHASQEANRDPRGHSHGSSSVDDAEAIVKLLEQRPTVFVQPNETKEILIRFNETGIVALSCVLDAHNDALISGSVEVK